MGDRTEVLLIEDNPGDVRLIREMLVEAKGIQFGLESTDRLSTGLRRLASGGIDVVLLDLSLPDAHELEAFTKAHALAPRVPMIVLTGIDDEELAIDAVRHGAQDYLVKGQVNSSLLVRSMRYAIERMRADVAMRESEERYRAVFEGAAEGILVGDIETGEFSIANSAMCRMLGYTEEELKRTGVRDIHNENVLKRMVSEFDALSLGEKTFASNIPFLRKDGTKIYVDIRSASVLIDARTSIVAFFTDITERKRAEEEREKAIRELREALEKIKTLRGLIPICAACKRIRDDEGYWHQVEAYFRDHSEAEFTHGLCPDCGRKLYPEFFGL